jgi:hypothetical protein
MDRVGVIAIQAPVDAFYVLWKSYSRYRAKATPAPTQAPQVPA